MAGVYFLFPFSKIVTEEEVVPYKNDGWEDPDMELGQVEVVRKGRTGIVEKGYRVTYTLSGRILSNPDEPEYSTIIQHPSDQIEHRGTKRWQYMLCSDGSYMYYTNEQFQDKNVGYTHQRPDSCAENGHGQMTELTNTPPPNYTYVNNYYVNPNVRMNCVEIIKGSSLTCYSY